MRIPATAAERCFLHQDKAPVYIAAAVRHWLEKNTALLKRLSSSPPHLIAKPATSTVDFWLFLKVKAFLAEPRLTQRTFKTTLELPIKSINNEEFAAHSCSKTKNICGSALNLEKP
jgi:hypothetical protein